MPFTFKPPTETESPQTGAPTTTPASSSSSVPTAPPSPASLPQPAPTTVSLHGGQGVTSLAPRPDDGEKRGIIQTVLFFIFGLVVTATIVLFGYSYYLNSQINSKKAELDSYESQLGGLPLDQMRALSNRFKIINQLVKDHPSVRAAFRILEDSIENPVTYTRFDFHFAEAIRSYELTLAAVAPDYHAVINQVDTLRNKPYTTYISNVSVENLQPDDTGKIGFSLKMPILVAGVLPEDLILATAVAESTTSETSVATTTNTTATTTTLTP